MATTSSHPDPPIYRLRASIGDSEPEIWRLLEVSSGLRLSELHDVLQIAFGWQHRHLHAFEHSDGSRYLDQGSIDEGLEGMDEEAFALGDIWRNGDGPLTYTYDFGDGWDHLLELIEISPRRHDDRPALLIRGEGAGPLEDSGGVHAYQEILATLRDPGRGGPRRRTRVGAGQPWSLGPAFDPEAVDVQRVDRMLDTRFAERLSQGWGSGLYGFVERLPPGVRGPFTEHLREAELDRPVVVDGDSWTIRSVSGGTWRVNGSPQPPPAIRAISAVWWSPRWRAGLSIKRS